MRAIASHQCGPGSTSIICALSHMRDIWVEFVGCTERFSPGAPVSPLQHLTRLDLC